MKHDLFIQPDRHTELLQRCPAWLYLPAPLRLYVRAHSSFGLAEVCGPPVDCFGLVGVFIKVTGPHGGVWRPRGADQELQPLLLQQLQSGKKGKRVVKKVLEFMGSEDVTN